MAVLAYTTPRALYRRLKIAYRVPSRPMPLLMSIYSMNNMPYAALGGVMTGDINERAKLNSFRFAAVNAAQFIVGGFTLPLVAKFAAGSDRQHGWQMTMSIWAVLCLVLIPYRFCRPPEGTHSSQDANKEIPDFAGCCRPA